MKSRILLTFTGCTILTALALRAEEGGPGHYVSGATASFIDALPDSPGWVDENIVLNYNNATAQASRGLPLGGVIAANVEANAYADS